MVEDSKDSDNHVASRAGLGVSRVKLIGENFGDSNQGSKRVRGNVAEKVFVDIDEV